MAISAYQLSGFREDLISMMKPLIDTGIVSTKRVVSVYDSAMSTIRAEAEKGARAGVNKEIPTIEKRVRFEAEKTVKPMVIGALAASGVALAVGSAALISIWAKRKG
jgi:hypothetical protein